MTNKKEAARGRANYLQRIGAIKVGRVCSVCGKPGVLEKHHPDYGRPDIVLWIHRSCHAALRRRHVRQGVELAVLLCLVTVLLGGCAFWQALTHPDDPCSVAVVQAGKETMEGVAMVLPSPWREIVIAALGLGGIVWQTISKRRLQKKFLPG